MKFLVFSEREILNYNTLEKHIVISITGSKYKHPELPPVNSRIDTLQLQFYDIDTPIDNYNPLSKKQAETIWSFFNRHKDNVTIVICQCEAGISRSAGVAAGLAKAVGQDDSEFFRNYLPNRLVYRLILEEANKEKNEF